MKEQGFGKWLQKKGISSPTIQSRISNCRRIERHFKTDLNGECDRDGLRDILKNLHRIPINGDRYTGEATLKQALKLYKGFCTVAPRKKNSSRRKLSNADHRFSKSATINFYRTYGGQVTIYIDKNRKDSIVRGWKRVGKALIFHDFHEASKYLHELLTEWTQQGK